MVGQNDGCRVESEQRSDFWASRSHCRLEWNRASHGAGEREVPKGGFIALVFGEWRSPQGHPSPDYAFVPDDEEAVAESGVRSVENEMLMLAMSMFLMRQRTD